MPPRKSNASAISATNEDGTPVKEPKDGVNIEVNPPSHLPQGTSSQLALLPKRGRSPLHAAKILPSRTGVSYTPYIMSPHGIVPYTVYPYGAPTELASTSSFFGFPGQLGYAAAYGYGLANAPAPFPYGRQDPLGPLGQFPFNCLPQSSLVPCPLYGHSRNTANRLEFRANMRIIALPQDLSLPKTMVQRLAKGVLPANTQIQKDAILAMQKGATVFVNYLAQAANATAQSSNRRTIPPPAIFDALHELEFDFMSDWVSSELNKFNDTNAGKRNEYRRKLKEEEKLKKEQEGGPMGDDDAGDIDEERAAKRARMGHEDNEEDGQEGGTRMNGHANGDESTMNGHDGVDDDNPIDLDENEEEGNGNEGEDEGQEEPEEPDEDEDDEEEDDEDEFPDEGRRLSSVEAETYTDGEARARRASEDEAISDEQSD